MTQYLLITVPEVEVRLAEALMKSPVLARDLATLIHDIIFEINNFIYNSECCVAHVTFADKLVISASENSELFKVLDYTTSLFSILGLIPDWFVSDDPTQISSKFKGVNSGYE